VYTRGGGDMREPVPHQLVPAKDYAKVRKKIIHSWGSYSIIFGVFRRKIIAKRNTKTYTLLFKEMF
jgi:hypothetical protein